LAQQERWLLKRRGSADFVRQHANLDRVLAQVLYARKMDTDQAVDAFLAGSDPGEPSLLPDIERAVVRISEAIEGGEPIVVYGDFDTDGVSATTLLVSALRDLGGDVSGFIPDRFDDGYGLNDAAIANIAKSGCRLLITVDCGVRSIAEVERAIELGLDVVITDHHSVPASLPAALAVVNPKRADSSYPFRELAGVGVAYRLVQALCAHSKARGGPSLDLDSFLDLVALGTVADIVPLVDENRTLVQAGLERLRREPRLGLQALMQVSGTLPERIGATDIGFRLGPRINAAGRLRHAGIAYRLLASEDESEAGKLAWELDQVNQERRDLLDVQAGQARSSVGALDGRMALVISGPDYHEGIVGLIASRLREEYHRPCLVMRAAGGEARGSARSIDGFHITKALEECSGLLVRYGGHAQAAGFTLQVENLEAFADRFQAYALEHIAESDLVVDRRVDAIVPLTDISRDTVAALDVLEPCGQGNPEPALASLGLRILAMRPVGAEGKHLRLQVGDKTNAVNAIAFRLGHLADGFRIGDLVDVVYRPCLNEFRGESTLQLVVSAMRHHT